MNAAIKQEQLRALVEVSRCMQVSAGEGDWESVNHLHAKSQQLAGELFAGVITIADVQAVTEAVNEVLKINKCVIDMGVVAREVYLGDMERHQQGRRAVKEYKANTK